jgi:hypothetical protein
VVDKAESVYAKEDDSKGLASFLAPGMGEP